MCKIILALRPHIVHIAHMNFSKLLFDKRAELSISQADMAKILAVSPRTYIYWESGERTPLETTQEGVIARLKAIKKVTK